MMRAQSWFLEAVKQSGFQLYENSLNMLEAALYHSSDEQSNKDVQNYVNKKIVRADVMQTNRGSETVSERETERRMRTHSSSERTLVPQLFSDRLGTSQSSFIKPASKTTVDTQLLETGKFV